MRSISRSRPFSFHRKNISISLILFVALFGVAGESYCAQEIDSSFDNKAALAFSQSVIGKTVSNHRFTNHIGQPVQFADFNGKPVVVSLVYTSCYHICPMVTRQLAKTVEVAREALGDDSFHVLTIGFDTAVDTSQAMAVFARQQGIRMQDWHFLSSDADTMAQFMNELGFSYQRSPKGFDHLLQATVIDAKGEVIVQVYGDVINSPLLVEPLKQLVFGSKPSATVMTNFLNKVRLFCTTYDPANNVYRFDYSLFIGIFIGAIIIGSVIVFLVRESLRNRNSRPV